MSKEIKSFVTAQNMSVFFVPGFVFLNLCLNCVVIHIVHIQTRRICRFALGWGRREVGVGVVRGEDAWKKLESNGS